MSDRIVYVAGAYSASTSWGRESNIRRAEEASLVLWAAGVPNICVHTMTRYGYGHVSEANAIAIGLALLRRCDAVYVVKLSDSSNGTMAEIADAASRGQPVFSWDEIDACIEWAKKPPAPRPLADEAKLAEFQRLEDENRRLRTELGDLDAQIGALQQERDALRKAVNVATAALAVAP